MIFFSQLSILRQLVKSSFLCVIITMYICYTYTYSDQAENVGCVSCLRLRAETYKEYFFCLIDRYFKNYIFEFYKKIRRAIEKIRRKKIYWLCISKNLFEKILIWVAILIYIFSSRWWWKFTLKFIKLYLKYVADIRVVINTV